MIEHAATKIRRCDHRAAVSIPTYAYSSMSKRSRHGERGESLRTGTVREVGPETVHVEEPKLVKRLAVPDARSRYQEERGIRQGYHVNIHLCSLVYKATTRDTRQCYIKREASCRWKVDAPIKSHTFARTHPTSSRIRNTTTGNLQDNVIRKASLPLT